VNLITIRDYLAPTWFGSLLRFLYRRFKRPAPGFKLPKKGSDR
jgi:hypothetical protein